MFAKNNVVGSASVFTAAIKNNVKRIVYCSSMARYGSIKPPFKEDDKPNPVDPYGISKLAAEKLLENLCETKTYIINSEGESKLTKVECVENKNSEWIKPSDC